MINSLLENGIKEDDIQTAAYVIDPIYEIVDGRQVLRSYRVTNTIIVTLRQLDNIGKIIDDAVANGANMVNNIEFSMSEPAKYYNRALKLAIQNAIQKAMVIQSKLNVQVKKTPVRITEESYEQIGRGVRAFEVPAVTPIMPGELKINARIEAVFTYLPVQ